MESTRSTSPVSSVCSEPIWLGIGSEKPRPRVKNTGMFGYVSDAFDGKSVNIGQLPAYSKSKGDGASDDRLAKDNGVAISQNDSNNERPTDGVSEVANDNTDTTDDQDHITTTDDDITHDKSATSECLLIKNGRIVNHDRSFQSDIYIEDGQIKLIGNDLSIPNYVQQIDATNKLIFPGGIDNVFLGKPFLTTRSVDDFCTGTKAALVGGTTCIMNYITATENESIIEAFDKWMIEAEQTTCCDYTFHVCINQWNDDVKDDMKTLTQLRGVNSFHVSMSDMNDSSDLYQFFQYCRELGAIAMVTARNGLLVTELANDLISQGVTGPEGCLFSCSQESECEAITRVAMLSNEARAPLYITSLTGKPSIDIVAKARKKGGTVFCEVAAAALALNSDQYMNKNWRHAASHVMYPPLRSSSSLPLIQVFSSGDDFQLVSSNHATFSTEQRALGRHDFRSIPDGVNGAEERMSILWNTAVTPGEMDLCRFVAVTSTVPAKLFNMYPRKGTVAVGSDADLVIWDPEKTSTISTDKHQSNSDFNIYDGMTITGQPVTVIQSGRVVIDNGEILATANQGKYIPRCCFGEYTYSRLLLKDKVQKPQPVERDPFDIELFKVTENSSSSCQDRAAVNDEHIYRRPLTSCGTRNLQDSSFSLSGMSGGPKNIQSVYVKRTCGTKISQPPGGSTTTQLW